MLAIFSAIIIIISSIWMLSNRVFCYDTNVAHPNIVKLAAELYNKKFPNAVLTEKEIACIEQGAREEDTPTRWLNHFYDPVSNQGLWFGKQNLSAKDWVQNPQAQTGFALGDQSWQRALSDYAKGDKEKAFQELGHVLHLLADMTVPAHTRNDVHIVGDSYEQFVKNNWDTVQKQLSLSALSLNANCASLNQCFNYLANYSNNNFYSDDTIEGKDYKIIGNLSEQIIDVGGGVYYKFFITKDPIDGKKYKLYFDKNVFTWQGLTAGKILKPDYKVKHDLILTDYSQHLLPKAISASASVIKLFLDEAQKEQKNDLPAWRIGLSGLGDAVIGKVVSAAEGVYDYLRGKTGVGQSATASEGETINNQTPSANNQTPRSTTTNSDSNKQIADSTAVKIKQTPNPNNQTPTPTVTNQISEIPPNISKTETEKLGNFETNNQQLPITNYQLPVTTPAPVVYYSGGGGTNTSAPEHLSTPAPTNTTNTTSTTPAPDPTASGGDGQPSTTSTSSTTFSTPDTTPPPAPEYLQTYEQIVYTDKLELTINLQVSTDTVKIVVYNDPIPNKLEPVPVGEIIINSSTIISAILNLNEDHNYLYFTAVDEVGNVSDSSPFIHYVLDTGVPPVPSLQINEQQNYSATSTTLNISLSGADSLTSTTYDLAYTLAPISSTSVWLDFVTNTAETQLTFSGARGQDYLFKARARDAFGHESDWGSSVNYQALYSQSVVINEVAWMGTSPGIFDKDDEWLELYNNTDTDIDLSNWQLLISGKPATWYKTPAGGRPGATSTIKAHSYYLIERTDDNAVYDILADGIFTGTLNNSGEKLTLVDNTNNIIDEVNCPTTTGWFKGSVTTYSSMERIDSAKDGSDATNWQTALGSRPTGISYQSSPIKGSPRQPNFGFVVLRDTQIEDLKVLDKVNNPWVLSDYNVPSGKELIVSSGVIIKGKPGAALQINGGLTVQGTSEEPVIITSGRDNSSNDNYLNTTIGTWSSSTPRAGDIQGLFFTASSTGNINNLILQYAGYQFKPSGLLNFVSQGVRAINANLTLNNSSILNTKGTAVYSQGGSLNFANNKFDGGDLAIDIHEYTNVSLTNSSFTDFTNTEGPVVINKADWPVIANLSFNNNALNKIYLNSLQIPSDTIALLSPELAQVAYFGVITVPTSSALQIGPGAEVNFANYGSFIVNGNLQSLGTAEAPIYLKPMIDNGQWGQIVFKQGSGQLNNTHLQRGNLCINCTLNTEGVIFATDSQVALNNVYLENTRRPGSDLQAFNSTIDINHLYVQDSERKNNSYGLNLHGGNTQIADGWFAHLAYGILADNTAGLQLWSEMSQANFEDVVSPIAWQWWVGFATSTP